VITDRCNSHGTWLDADELEQIAGYLLSGGRPKAEKFMRETEAQAEADYRAARMANIAADRAMASGMGMGPRRPAFERKLSRDGGLGGGVLGLLSKLLDD
jgi:hypothetical protein